MTGFEPGGREFESLRARHLLLTGHVVREGRRPLGSRLPIWTERPSKATIITNLQGLLSLCIIERNSGTTLTKPIMILNSQYDLPDRIQSVVASVEGAGQFLGAIKTSLKPNATIPLLWLAITDGYLLLCNTHRSRGLTEKIRWSEVNCIRRRGNS